MTSRNFNYLGRPKTTCMRRILFVALYFVSFSAVCQPSKLTPPVAENGVLDLRTWDFKEKIALTGHWILYKNQFTDTTSSTKSTSRFPEVWDPSIQYGSYHLRVLLPSEARNLAFEIPQLYCSYQLWVNGTKVAQNGKIGNTKESTVPQWLPQVALLHNQSDTLSLVLHISNFYHYKGGAKDPIYLGTSDILHRHHNVAIESSLVESVGLAVMGLAFVLIYYLREEKKKITLYFSLLCFSWALRAEFSNLYVFISYFPNFDWATMVRIEYITLFLTMIWAILFLSRLFPNESSKTIKYILVGANSAFIALAVIASPLFFTQWLDVYLLIAAALMVFAGLIVVRAWINERSGVRYIVVSTFLSIGLFAYDIFVYEGFFYHYNALLFSIGYLTMFLLMGVSLLYHLQIFKSDGSSGMLTYEDLYGKTK